MTTPRRYTPEGLRIPPGIDFDRANQRWRARIQRDGDRLLLGTSRHLIVAVALRDMAARPWTYDRRYRDHGTQLCVPHNEPRTRARGRRSSGTSTEPRKASGGWAPLDTGRQTRP